MNKSKELTAKLISMFDADIQEVLERIKTEDPEGKFREKWDYMAQSEVSNFWIDALIDLQNYMDV